MLAKTLMLQGTSSSVGKSLLVAGLCRIFNDDGYRVVPFKSQNMALNSAVTPDGYEISRSQTMQAEAARVIPMVEMNPILLKPKGDMRAQVILRGKPYGDFGAREYREQVTKTALQVASECLECLRLTNDLVIIEGAGSPAEVNLRENDIANMKIAEIGEAPVILIGDIDRGGCLASLVGTLELLTPDERERVKGLIINKFRGDISLLEPGLEFLNQKTGLPILGVLPYLKLELPEEDSQGLKNHVQAWESADTANKKILIGVIRLPRISNFTDFDSLICEPDVELIYISNPQELEKVDLIVIPGTKNTSADLEWLHQTGLTKKIQTLATRKIIFGICGGYQMLGWEIRDPFHLESDSARVEGLGLLPIRTHFTSVEKTTKPIQGTWTDSAGNAVNICGYEIHQGTSEVEGTTNLFALKSGKKEGCQIGNIYGTYWHGCFDNDEFRWEILDKVCQLKALPIRARGRSYKKVREESYSLLADMMRQHLNMAAIYQMMGLKFCAHESNYCSRWNRH